jgi:hypothetical protein
VRGQAFRRLGCFGAEDGHVVDAPHRARSCNFPTQNDYFDTVAAARMSLDALDKAVGKDLEGE